MAQQEQNILNQLKQQFLLYKKQSAILVGLALLLVIVALIQFSGGTPRKSKAAELVPPSSTSVPAAPIQPAAAVAVPSEPAAVKPILAHWSELQTTLKRTDLFRSPQQSETGAPDGDPDEDGVVNSKDNCPKFPNPDQQDGDGDGIGNLCDEDHQTSIDSIALVLKGTTITENNQGAPSAYINNKYYEVGATFTVDDQEFTLISVHRNKAVVKNQFGNTRVLRTE